MTQVTSFYRTTVGEQMNETRFVVVCLFSQRKTPQAYHVLFAADRIYNACARTLKLHLWRKKWQLDMACCLMAQKISTVMQNSCSCSECIKWKEFGCSTAKMNKHNQGSMKRQHYLERRYSFAQGLLQITLSSFKSDPKKSSSQKGARTVQWRFVFFHAEKKDKK